MFTRFHASWLILLAILLLVGLVPAQSSTSGPAAPPAAEPVNKNDLPVTLKPGETHDNGAATAKVDADSQGGARITPRVAREGLPTVIDFFNKAKGSVTNLSAGETVNVTSGAKVDVTGSGGTINLSGTGASVHVTNNGTGTITVLGKSGTTTGSFGPGESGTISNT